MPQNYVPIFIFVALIGVLIPVTLFAAKLVRPENPSRAKLGLSGQRPSRVCGYPDIANYVQQRRDLCREPLDQRQSFLSNPHHCDSAACEPGEAALFGSSEESIAIGKVASVQISRGI